MRCDHYQRLDGSGPYLQYGELQLELLPTSVVYGDPPVNEPDGDYHDDQNVPRVDIREAISKAKKRMGQI